MSRDSTTFDEYTSFNKDDQHHDAFDYADEYPPLHNSAATSWRTTQQPASLLTKRNGLLASALLATWALSLWITFVATRTGRSTSAAVRVAPDSAIARLAPTEEWANGTQLVDFDIDGPWDGKALKALCDKTEFVPGRWMSCPLFVGGVGNVREALLVCLRYTIEAGAGWVLPSLAVRGEIVFGEEHLHTGGQAGIEFMWDVDFLKTSLKDLCPKMGVAENVAHIPDYTFASFPPPLDPLELHSAVSGVPASGDHAGWPHQQNLDQDSFRADFDVAYPAPEDVHKPVVVRLSKTIWQWIIQRDPFEFWSTFGRVLRFRADAVVLASQVYHQLEGMSKEGYFGMHLR